MRNAQGPQCNYPVIARRMWHRNFRRPCGKRASWRVEFWYDPPRTAQEAPSQVVYRCSDHRCHDVQTRMLSELTREVRL